MQWLQNNTAPDTATPVTSAIFHSTFTPSPAKEYAPGPGTVQGVWYPNEGFTSLMPLAWTIPARVGDCVPGIGFVFAMPGGGGFIYRRDNNDTMAALEETVATIIDQFVAASGGTLNALYFYVTNVNVAAQTETIGEFAFQGFQV